MIDHLYVAYKNIRYVHFEGRFGLRQDRLPTCCFWKYADERIGLEKSYNVYLGHHSEGKHRDWCLFFPFWEKSCESCLGEIPHKFYSENEFHKFKNIREGVKDLGVALHHECHDSLELTQYRLLGAKKIKYVFITANITATITDTNNCIFVSKSIHE